MSWLAWLIAAAPLATASEFREITLSNDRVIRGEVLASSDTGLRLQLHQGTTFVPYSDIQIIQDLDEAGWRGSDRVWTAAVVPFTSPDPALLSSAETATALVEQALAGFPGIALAEPTAAILDCGPEPSRLLPLAREAGLDLLLLGEVEPPPAGEQLRITAIFTASDRARSGASIPWDAGDERAPVVALNVLYPALGLEPDPERIQALIEDTDRPPIEPEPPAALTAETPTDTPPQSGPSGLTRGQVARLSFVPVPGFPSLYQRDLRRFGMSWAAVVPATAIYVGAVGASSVRRTQLLGMGVAGYYVMTVAVNQIMGVSTLESRPLLSIEPQRGGGVARLTVPLH